jgi:hypothetical protein
MNLNNILKVIFKSDGFPFPSGKYEGRKEENAFDFLVGDRC